MKTVNSLPPPEVCNCFAVRAAARHVTQSYDQFLQARFEAVFGAGRAAELRRLLRAAAASEFAPGTQSVNR